MKSLNAKNFAIKWLMLSTMLLSSVKLMAAEKDLYDFLWLDPDKKVYVLQNKVHKKEHTVYANLGVGLGLSSTFQDTSMFHGHAGYYFNEEWAAEVMYTSYSNKDNEALENLKRLNGSIPFIRKTKSNYGVLAKWSPFYGLEAESNAATVAVPTSANIYKKESYTSVIGKTELTLHATKNIHVGLGLIMNNYKAPGPTINGQVSNNKLRNNLDAVLTVGFSF